MKTVVFGANGSTGSEIVRVAKAASHQVVATVRRPESMAGVEGVEVAKIDLMDSASLVEAIAGCDAVVMAIGHGGAIAASKPTTLYSDSVQDSLC